MKFDNVERARINYVKNRRKTWWSIFGAIIGGLVIAILIAYTIGYRIYITSTTGLIVIGTITLIAVATVVTSLTNILTKNDLYNYKKNYKAYFIEKQLANYISELYYQHNAGLNRDILSATGLIDTGDVFTSNDLTVGTYKKVKFMQADAHSQKEYTDDKGNKHYKTIFKGRWIVFEFPKEFKFRIALAHNKIPTYYVNPRTGKGLHIIKTESESFNKRFIVQAEDDFETFYILDPVFIENLEQLGEQHNDNVAIYFANNKMIIGINDGNDVFEPPTPQHPINEEEELQKVTKEMKLITNIVDNLRLNR